MTKEQLTNILVSNLMFDHTSNSHHVFLREPDSDTLMLRFQKNTSLTYVSALVVDSYRHLAEFIAENLIARWKHVQKWLNTSGMAKIMIPLPENDDGWWYPVKFNCRGKEIEQQHWKLIVLVSTRSKRNNPFEMFNCYPV